MTDRHRCKSCNCVFVFEYYLSDDLPECHECGDGDVEETTERCRDGDVDTAEVPLLRMTIPQVGPR
jgi:hypothetical protein